MGGMREFVSEARERGLRVRVLNTRQNPLNHDYKDRPFRNPGEPYLLCRYDYGRAPWVFLAGDMVEWVNGNLSAIIDLAHDCNMRVIESGRGRTCM